MSDQYKITDSKKAIAAVAGVGVCFLMARYHTRILRQIQLLLNFRDPLRYQQVHIVSNTDECRALMTNLKLHCAEYKVLGFDCEWVTVGGTRRPVALLQLASHKGLCGLIRLCNLQRIPSELKELLEDDSIIKVGVAPFDDAKYLAKDYGVCVASTLDLRFLAALCNYKAFGLAKLSEDHLNVKLDKNWRVRCSDWEAAILSKVQIEYSAKDAHIGIELFKAFANKLKPKHWWNDSTQHVQHIIDEYCFSFLDLKFTGLHTYIRNGKNEQNGNKTGGGLFANKFQTRNIATRQKPLYYNCFLEAPDGELLCSCAKKKALWYVEKNIGNIIAESPFTVRLKFEPAGRAVGETGKYYQTPKLNQCVVCGEAENYIRKNIIPREYRKFFPCKNGNHYVVMKDHTSHDVLLLCPRCHQLSNATDLKVREQLALQCDAPFKSKEGGMKIVEVPRLRELKSICRALLYHRNRIPSDRSNELLNKLQELCPDVVDFSDEFLESFVDIYTTEINENYFAHGAKVVEYYQNSQLGLVALERLWREHFLRTMRPKFLPELWSVEHNVERLGIRAEEGRIDESDLRLAGLA